MVRQLRIGTVPRIATRGAKICRAVPSIALAKSGRGANHSAHGDAGKDCERR